MKEQNFTTNKNICFIANFYKTWFFHEIAQQLIKNGVNVYWIVPKVSQVEKLKKHYSPNNILKLDRDFINTDNEIVNDFKINELIFGDRVLRNEVHNGQKFLANIQKPIYDFLKINKINLVIGEVTWAHELLIHRLVTYQAELNCKYYSMNTVRIPNGRFAFFEDEKQAKLVEKESYSPAKSIQKILAVEKPAYLKENDAILKRNMSLSGRLSRIKRFITGENIEKTDPNVNIKGFFRWKGPVREEFNRECYKLLKKENLESILKNPFIFFGFHKQPESSVDVSGRYFENQMDNVINLWRQLPLGWKLVVKEHTNAIGDRSYKFYKKLKKYPGIILANEKIDSHQLIKHSQLVATNTGTIALEAALFEKPSITLSPVFFNKHNYCHHANWSKIEEYQNIQELITEITKQNPNSEEYTNYILKNTFEGVIGDTNANPAVIKSDNISKISSAVLYILSCNKKSKF